MKNFFKILALIIMLLTNSFFAVSAVEPPPSVSADSCVLMDGTTGEILYAKNMDAAYPPASTTKIMTALLTFEKCKMTDIVKVGKKPPFADGSKVYLYENEEVTVKDLLYALLLESANDSAEALAEHISGTEENFAVLMNQRAKELGCTNTNFINSSGLYDKNHKTSGKDLAIIMRELVTKHPEFIEISTTPSYKMPPTNKQLKERPLWNKDRLIHKNTASYYEGIEGGKIGYTIQSFHSYVASASRNGQRLIVTFVHDTKKTYFEDAIALFNYGFKNYQLQKVCLKGDELGSSTVDGSKIPLLAEKDFYYVKEKNAQDKAAIQVAPTNLKSSEPIKKGEVLSQATIVLNNKTIGTVPLISGADHVITSVFQKPVSKSDLFTKLIYVGTGAFLLLLSVGAALYTRKNLRKRSKAKNYTYSNSDNYGKSNRKFNKYNDVSTVNDIAKSEIAYEQENKNK